ncbi:MAG TPA: SRPBCC family protein [Oligoflexia bacterium]|nr:SRPBCC family protein [Oligoflexia bacterium]
MAEASKTMEMNVSAAALWKTITNYEGYSQFVDGVKSVQVLSRAGGNARVQYNIELLGKTITYTLDHVEVPEKEMTWQLVESNVMKANDGGWTIKDLGSGRVSVTYRLALEFKIFVPGMILNGLVKNMLPRMMESFEKRSHG